MKTAQQNQNPEESLYSSNSNKPHHLTAEQREQQQMEELEKMRLRIQSYPDLKELPIANKSAFDSSDKLWRDSPCTLKNVQQNITIDRSERFKLGSIYYRDKLNEQKKVFTESEKPDLLLKNFRRQIAEATPTKGKYATSSSASRELKRSNALGGNAQTKAKNSGLKSLSSTMAATQTKFYNIPEKIELKYDRNGSRSNYVGDYDVKEIMNRFKSNKRNFSSSRRMDLGLPLNYYPGPGHYFKQNQSLTCRSNTFHLKMSKVQLGEEGIKTERKVNGNLQEI